MRQAPIRTTAKNSPARRRGRSQLLGGASALAAAVMLLVAPQQASAQIAVTGRAFEANPTASPDFTITRSDTQDVVQVLNSTVVINWRPIDTATSSAVIDILPVGNTLAFTGDGAYTVLNRVIPDDPTRAIQFNGGVISLNGGALGGNIWFYSPGGIIAGPTSVFLVGGLVLTSSNLTGIDAGGNQMNFLGATAGSRVEVQPGARLLSSDYMVLWAPRVVQGGGVAAGGNVSYVGAESGSLTVTGGLFDMVINVGTDDPNGVVHTGITTGPTPADNPVRAITMATVAKNDFVNMLVGGAVGYADASVATAGNGIIVLSAANGTQPNSGNITIGPAALNSTTLASASGDLTIALDGQGQALTIGSATNEADFIGLAGRNLTINATSGATVNAADNFFAQAASPGQGGTLTVNIDDAGRDDDSSFSGLLVGGNLTLSAFGNGVDNIPLVPISVTVSPTFGGDGNGGTIGINVSQGGELFVGGTTLLSAAGTAGIGSLFSGDATGGTINFTLDGNNSRVQLGGNALFDASANRSAPGPVNAGGEVDAGSINLALNSGSFTFSNLTLTANADADDSLSASGRPNGARGGTIQVSNTARLSGNGLTMNALGLGGNGGTSVAASDAGGDGEGGIVSLANGAGGSLTLAALGIDVSGTGGEGASGAVLVAGGRGGSGIGGDIAVSNAGTLTGNPTVTLGAAGRGGNGGTGGVSLDDSNPGADGGAAGGGFGGTVNLVANGATTALQINSLISASGIGGTGGTGGDARSFASGNGGVGGFGQGGDISLVSTLGGSLEITAGTGTLTLASGGFGGAGGDEGFGANPVGNPGQNGGSAGGTIEMLADQGALTITGNLIADASAVGNRDLRDGATGADATGGTITVNASDGGTLTTTGGLSLNASAIAAIGNLSAGTGRGGTANLLMSGAGSTFNVQGQFPLLFADPPRGRALFVDTSAHEPQSGNPLLQTASGGDTFGGAINLAFAGGNSTIAGRTELRNFSGALNPLSGVGPGPQLFVNNATATGGTIDIALTDGTHSWGSVNGSVTTFGFGGSAVNGTVRATLDNATLNLIATPGGNGRLSLDTYVAGEISQSDPDAVVVRVLNGSNLNANGGIFLFADTGHGVGSNPITTGNVVLEVDASTVSVATNTIFLGNEAQAFRFPGTATNTTGVDALPGDVTFRATNGSTITGSVQIRSFAQSDAGPDGGNARSGNLSYLLDGSTHAGNIGMLSFAEGQGAGAAGGTGGTTTGGNQSIAIRNGANYTGDIDLETTLYTYHFGAAGGAYGGVQGGTSVLEVTDSTADIGVLSNLFDGGADPAAMFEDGANITAGSFALQVANSTVTIGDASINLDATGGQGGDFSVGGTGQAGAIVLRSDATSSLTINDAAFSANGFGGQGGGAVSSGDGAAGGSGIGGVISVSSLGNLQLNSLLATARGQGGVGGPGALGGAGGDGGFGQGGTTEFEVSTAPALTVTLGPVTLDSSATGGAGASGDTGFSSLSGGAGGMGGSAAGGTSRFRVTGAGSTLAFDPFLFTLSSSALGGAGGAGGNNFSGGTAGVGGDGGAAIGGTVALEAGSGAELSLLQVSAGPFQMQVTGTGGNGGAGGSIDMISGGTAGAGGNGGQGTGGSPTLRAEGGRIIVGELDIRATGFGGAGGIAGTDGMISLAATGNGGNGFGGTPLLETLDGSPGRLTLGTVVIDASGFGGSGTIIGSSGGGQITITDGSADPAGLITMGSLTVTASGPLTPPGTASLTIEGSSGPITVTGDVNATVAGDINFVFDGTGQLAVGGATTLGAGGDIILAHTNNITGLASLDSGTDLIATAGGNFIAGAGSIINAGRDVSITAQSIQFASIAAVRDLLLAATNGDITAVGAAGLVAGRVLDLEASEAIVLGDIESDLSIALTAGTSVTAGNLTSTGSDTIGEEGITIVAGGDVSLGTVDALDGLTITGAGLTATSLDGQSVSATMTGAIDVGTATAETTIGLSGTSIALDNGDATGNITLGATAGAIALGTINSETDLAATATGDISFTNLTGRVVTLDSGGNITGGSAAADRNVASGVSRNVNLTAVGDISVASASAVADVVVRGASFAATSVVSGTGLTDNIDVLVGGAVNIGSTRSGGQTVLTGSSILLGSGVAGAGASVLTATSGDVSLTSFDSENFLDIVSAGSVAFDTLTARALSIDSQSNVTGTRAATDINLVSGRPRNVSITALNAVSVDQIAAIDDVVIDAFTLNTLSVTAGADLLATLVGVGNIITVTTGGNATVSGSSLAIGDGVSGGLALLTATVGDVDLGTWDAQVFFDIDAVGSVNFDRVTGRLVEIIAGGDITGNFAAADVNLTSGRPRNVTLDAGGAVTIGEARSIGNVLLDGTSVDAGIVNAAGTGTFTASGLVAVGDLTTGGATAITAGSADIGTASTALFTANTSGAFAIDGLVINGATADALVSAGGGITLGTIQGARVVRLNGATITGGTITAVGSIDLDAGSVILDRAASSNGVITIDSTIGGISVDDLDSTTFGIRVNSAADFDSLTIDAGGLVQIIAAGNATLGIGNAGSSFAVNAGGNITSGNLFAGTTSPGITLTAGGAATLADLTTNGLINVNAGGALTGGLFASAGQITLRGSSIAITSAIASGVGGIAATSTVGDIAADLLRTASLSIDVVSADAVTIGAIEAGSSARVTTVNDASLGSVTATNGQVTLNIGGNLTAANIFGGAGSPGLDINVGGDARLGSVSSGGLLDIDATGDLTADVLQANGGLTVDAATISITSANSDTFGVGLRSTVGGVTADLLTAAGSIQVASATGATLGTLDAGANIDLTAGGTSTLGTAAADGNLTVTVTGNLTSGALAAGATPTSVLDLNVTGNARVASAQSGFILDVDVGGALTGGTFASGSTTIDAGSVNVTGVAGTASGGVIVNATTGNALIGTVDSGGNARINALAGVANVGTLNAALLGEIIGRSVTLDTATLGGNLRLQATAGNVAGTGAIDVAGAIDLDATGNISFGTLVARGGAFTADAGGDLTFAGASASNLLAFVAGGAVSGGNLSADSIALSAGTGANLGNLSANGTITVGAGGALTAGDIVTIVSGANNSIALTSAGAMTLGNVTSGEGLSMIAGGALILGTATTLDSTAASSILASGTGVTAELLATRFNSGAGVTVDAGTGLADIGRIQAGGASSVAAGSIALDSADVRGNLRLLANSGGIVATGLLDVRGASDFDAAGPVTLTTLLGRAQIAIDTPGLLSFDRIANPANSGGTIRLTAGAVQGTDLATNVSGADDSIFVTSAGDLALATVTSGQAITLDAGGALTLGSAQTLDAAATSLIAITGASVDAGSLTTMVDSGARVDVTATAGAASLGTVTAGGDVTMSGETIALATGDIRGGLSLASTVGDITLAPDGTGQIRVGGSTSLTSAGSILLTHTNNTGGLASLDSAGNIVAQADNGITTAAGSILSGNEVFILAGRDVDLADVRAVPGLVITAGGSVALANAAVTGPQGLSNISGIRIDAGLDPRGSSGYDSLGNVSITGSINSYADIAVNAGGSAEFAAGSQSLAGNGIVVRTGDDIIVGAGALLQSARDPGLTFAPADPFGPTGAIDLHAGGLTPLLSTPLTPIASLVVDGSIDAGRGAVIARANAIDGVDGSFAGSSLSFDIDDTPADGAVLSDDNGLLTAPCLEGNVCLGGLSASNQLLVGQSSPAEVLSLTIAQGTLNAREIRIATRNNIVLGSEGIATTLNASDLFSAESRTGNVDLREVAIASDLILIEAAGSLLGNASLTSLGDVGITVGDSLFADTIVAGGKLTTVSAAGEGLEIPYSLTGTLAIGTLSIGVGPVDYTAGTIVIGSLTAPGANVRLTASGVLSLGQTADVAGLALDGGSVIGGDLVASGNIAILSGSGIELASAGAGGSVVIDLAGDLSFDALEAGTDILVNAGGAANGGDLVAGGTIALDASRIAIGSASADILALTSATDVLFDFLTSPNSISITASTGRIAGNTSAGLIESGGDLTLRARTIDLRDLSAGGTLDIAVTGPVLTLGRLDAGADIVLGSAGSIFVDHAEAAGNFTATSVLGFGTGPNSIITGGDILIGAGGPVSLGNSSAGGLIDVSGSQIDFASLVAGTTIALSTVASSPTAGGTGDITGGSLQAGAGSSSLVTTAGDIVLSGNASVSGDLSLVASGGDIGLGAQTSAGGLLNLVGTGAIAAGNLASATGNVQADAGLGISVADVTAGNDIRLVTIAGNIGFGTITAGRDMTVSAAGNLTGLSIDAGRDSDLQADSDSSGAGDLALTGRARAVRDLTLLGANVSLADVVVTGVTPAPSGRLSGFATINSTNGSLLVGDVTAPGMTLVSEGGDLVAGNLNAFDPVLAFGLPTVIDVSAFGGDITIASLNSVGDVSIFNADGALTRVLSTTIAGNDVLFTGAGEFRFDGAVIAGRDLIGRANGATGAGVTFGAGLDIGRNVDVRVRNGAIFLLPGLSGPSTIGGNLTFDAQQIGLSAVDVGGSLALTATDGAIDATAVGTVGNAITLVASDDVTFGSLSAGGGSFAVEAGGNITFGAAQSSDTITMTAAGDLSGGDLSAPGLVSLDAARIVLGDATAGSFAIASGSDILFDSLASDSSLDLVAGNGRIGANTGPGNLNSGGNITLLAQQIALGTLSAVGDITATTNLGAMDFVAVETLGSIVLASAGSLSVDHAEAAGNFTGTAGLDFATGLNSILTGGDIVIAAGGIVALGNSSAGGLIDVTGQQIGFDALTAGQTVTLQTVLDPQTALHGNGDIAGQSITAGIGDSLISARDGGDITLSGTITADAVQVVAGAGAITSGGVNTRLFAILNAAGAITLTGSSLGTNTFFADGASIDLGGSSITNGNVTLTARNGDVTGTGSITADGELVVSAIRSVSLLGDLVSASAIRIDGNAIALGNAQSAGGISLRAANGGIGSTGTISAGRDLSVETAGGATLNELVAGDDAIFNGSGDISITNLLVTGDNPAVEEIGSNGTFTIDGSVFVDHAEIADNLTANVTGGFATGPNSILAGGDIVIDAGGPVALGSSSAGGLVDVTGSQIDFSTLVAGQTVTLLSEPSSQTGFGNGNITGTDLTAGAGASSVTSTFGAVAIGGQTTVAGSLAVGANQGITLGTVAVQGGDLTATAGGSIALGTTSASGNARLTAGGSITATGDIAARGTITLLAQTGAIAARDLIASGLTATAAGSIGLRDAVLSGGGATLVSGGAVALRDVSGAGASGVSITADGNLGFEDIVSAGNVSIVARNGGIDGVSIASGGAVSATGQTVGLGTVAATGDVVATAQTGALVAGSVTSSTGAVLLQGASAVDVATLAAATNATVEGGQVTLGSANAGGDLALASGAGHGIAAGALTAGGSIAASAGAGGFAGTTLDAGGDISLGSAAGIGFDTINSGGAASLVSTADGTIAGTAITAGTTVAATTGGSLAADAVSAGGAVNLSAVNGISLATLIGSSAQLAAAGGEVRVSVEIDVPGLVEASGQSVFLRSTRNLAVTALATAGDIDVLTERDLDVRSAAATGGNISLTSIGGVATVAGINAALPASGIAAGGNVFIEAGENLNVAGAVTAANSIELRAGERASIDAAVVGREIDLRASDVAIASSGSLGRLDTTRSVTLAGGSTARIGGVDGTEQDFVIDNDEFARIQASESIGISASTAIILDQLDIRVASAATATGNVRGGGQVSFAAAEGIDVIGEVLMTGATADNALALATGGDVFLDASAGLLEINDGAGNYLGLIGIEAANFYAMTEQARADVAAATGIDAIDDRLAQNDGIDNPDGLIRAGTLDITTIASDVFIQNTAPGTRFEERRGFTVDQLLISDPGGTNQPIVINGIIAGATGIDAVLLAQISSAFDPGSTINGCLIANPANCVQIPEHLGEGFFPVQDLIEEELSEDETSEQGLESGVLDTPLFELKDPLDSVEDPLLDDPVTGAGNEDLWVGDQPEG